MAQKVPFSHRRKRQLRPRQDSPPGSRALRFNGTIRTVLNDTARPAHLDVALLCLMLLRASAATMPPNAAASDSTDTQIAHAHRSWRGLG